MKTFRLIISTVDENPANYKDIVIIANAEEGQIEEMISRITQIYFEKTLSPDEVIKRMILKNKDESELSNSEKEIISSDKTFFESLKTFIRNELSEIGEGSIETYVRYKNDVFSKSYEPIIDGIHMPETYFNTFLK